MDSHNLPGVEINDYFSRLGVADVIRAGLYYAIGEEWGVVDETVVPAYERAINQGVWDAGFNLRGLLKSGSLEVRDYAATLLDSYFRSIDQNYLFLDGDPSELSREIVGDLENAVSKDCGFWSRVMASIALVSAYQRGLPGKRNELKDRLIANLGAGIEQDPSLEGKVRPQLDYLLAA